MRIFERAPHPRELGFALNLAPNAMAALQELGLAETVRARGAAPAEVELRGAGGRVLRRLNIAATIGQATSIVALRPALHGALLETLDADTLELDSDVAGFDLTPSGVTLRFSDGRAVAGDVLVGADGIGSIVRAQLHPDGPPLRDSGYVAVRGVADDGV